MARDPLLELADRHRFREVVHEAPELEVRAETDAVDQRRDAGSLAVTAAAGSGRPDSRLDRGPSSASSRPMPPLADRLSPDYDHSRIARRLADRSRRTLRPPPAVAHDGIGPPAKRSDRAEGSMGRGLIHRQASMAAQAPQRARQPTSTPLAPVDLADRLADHRDADRSAPSARPAGLLALQQLAGNRAVAQLLSGGVVAQRQRRPTPPGSALRVGSRGPEVTDLQQKLNGFGASPRLAVDGKFGPRTRRAVLRFQAAHAADHLRQTGEIDSETRSVLAATPEISADERELGRRIADNMELANQRGTEDSGIYYAENYRRRYGRTARGRSLTPDDYRMGYADPVYFERLGYWDWRLRAGVSAAAGLRSFMRGLTIAECNSVAGAAYMDAVRAALGDRRFDDRYGSADRTVAPDRRLQISPMTEGTDPTVGSIVAGVDARTRPGGPGSIGHRPVRVGEWYYFQNHPKYPSKHPTGSWQGENAIYLGVRGGEQRWSGFGASNVTERYMLNKLVQFYNRPSPGWTDTPQLITVESLLRDGGGLLLESGTQVDVSGVRGML
jgi:hypothetical protein